MAESHFDEWIARNYARLWPEIFLPDVLDQAVEVLAELAVSGSALEFGIGTGGWLLRWRAAGSRCLASSYLEPWSKSYAAREAPQ